MTFDLGRTSLRQAVLHEMGHTFGLRDECATLRLPAGAPALVPGPPNCAPDRATAERWWGDLARTDPLVGYFEGCAGQAHAVRPTLSSFMSCGRPDEGEPTTYGAVSLRFLRNAVGLER